MTNSNYSVQKRSSEDRSFTNRRTGAIQQRQTILTGRKPRPAFRNQRMILPPSIENRTRELRSHVRKLGQRRIQMIPGVTAGREHHDLRLEGGGIIERANVDTEHIRLGYRL